jgi:hypothetical protein
MTGYPDRMAYPESTRTITIDVLPKPFTRDQLLRKIQEVMAG